MQNICISIKKKNCRQKKTPSHFSAKLLKLKLRIFNKFCRLFNLGKNCYLYKLLSFIHFDLVEFFEIFLKQFIKLLLLSG